MGLMSADEKKSSLAAGRLYLRGEWLRGTLSFPNRRDDQIELNTSAFMLYVKVRKLDSRIERGLQVSRMPRVQLQSLMLFILLQAKSAAIQSDIDNP
jgi:hypothetical protein